MLFEGMSKDEFGRLLSELIIEALNRKGKRRAEFFTNVMNTARAYELEDAALQIAHGICLQQGEPDLWEVPKAFESGQELPAFPLDSLPGFLSEYVKALADHVQVFPEMIVLPLLSVLSLCVQGKASICYPGNSHTEPLNLYTLTIAAPGERKSGCLRELLKPALDFQTRWNSSRREAIAKYKTERAFLEQRKTEAMRGKCADLNAAKNYTEQLLKLQEVHEMKLIVKDTTPEALARELATHGERIGVLDDEGSLFDVLSGLYSNGQTNISLFLEAYDGAPYSISRSTREDVVLNSPLLTLGLMVQPSHFDEAMSNKQFSGRGFIHRFLYSFPASKADTLLFESPDIPGTLKYKYTDLIERLLVLPCPEASNIPNIKHTSGSKFLFKEYFDRLQEGRKPGGRLETLTEWTAKQLSRALRIAGIFHLCKHGEKFASFDIEANTAKAAIKIAQWSEAHAFKALSEDGGESETVKTSKQILEKLKKLHKEEITKGELLSTMRNQKANDLYLPLEMLADMKYIRLEEVTSSSKGGRKRQIIKVNPLVFDIKPSLL